MAEMRQNIHDCCIHAFEYKAKLENLQCQVDAWHQQRHQMSEEQARWKQQAAMRAQNAEHRIALLCSSELDQNDREALQEAERTDAGIVALVTDLGEKNFPAVYTLSWDEICKAVVERIWPALIKIPDDSFSNCCWMLPHHSRPKDSPTIQFGQGKRRPAATHVMLRFQLFPFPVEGVTRLSDVDAEHLDHTALCLRWEHIAFSPRKLNLDRIGCRVAREGCEFEGCKELVPCHHMPCCIISCDEGHRRNEISRSTIAAGLSAATQYNQKRKRKSICA